MATKGDITIYTDPPGIMSAPSAGGYILDSYGKPQRVSAHVAAAWMGDHKNFHTRVRHTDVFNGKIRVSTAFLCLDHGYGEETAPVLWETMVFGAAPEPWGDFQERYTSAADAIAGHDRVVAMIEAGQLPDTPTP